ncbi:MAG: zinc metallopeptidase [Rhodomicrobium sp.]|nr:zinc metallopeptidase [Rhodomicrobium sp.]
MRWRNREGSENVEDRRGESARRRRFPFPFPDGGDGFPGMPRSPGRASGIGIIGFLIVLGLMIFLGVDPRVILNDGGGQISIGDGPRQGPVQSSPQEDELAKFVSVVLKTTEDVWSQQFAAQGRTYSKPNLVLFRGGIDSGCGFGAAQMGPFYCPLDQKIYIDLSFYDALKNRFKAPGDFAQAYVIAHEVGHHIQTLLGITQKVMEARQRVGEREGNAIQVRMELQADCLAGVWAHQAQQKLDVVEPGDIEEALNAAAAIGDDNIQRRTQGHVVPDAFTHGSAEQRVTWFRRGFDSGRMDACDTFGRSI